MNKDLEKEYKLNIESELPDLWSRIEAALPEKEFINTDSTAEDVLNENVAEEMKAENVVSFDKNVKYVKPVNKKKVLFMVSGIAVAAIFLLIAIPAIVILPKLRLGGNSAPQSVNTPAGIAAVTALSGKDEAACEEAYDYDDSYADCESEDIASEDSFNGEADYALDNVSESECEDSAASETASEEIDEYTAPDGYMLTETDAEVSAYINGFSEDDINMALLENAVNQGADQEVYVNARADMSRIAKRFGRSRLAGLIGKNVYICADCYMNEQSDVIFVVDYVEIIE